MVIVKLKDKSSIFHDAFQGITITGSEAVKVNKTPNIAAALRGGALVIGKEDELKKKDSKKEDSKKEDSKKEELKKEMVKKEEVKKPEDDIPEKKIGESTMGTKDPEKEKK